MTNQKRLLPPKITNLAVTLLIGTGLLILLSLSLLFWVPPAHAKAGVVSYGQYGAIPNQASMAASNPITLSINTLPADKQLKIVFASVITDPFTDLNTQVQNQGSISGSNLTTEVLTADPDTATPNDPTVTNVTLQANLGLLKTVTPTTVIAGDTLTYTLTFSNAFGTGQWVSITDVIPVSVTVQQIISSGVTLSQTNVGNTYVWTTSFMTSGQEGIITITGQMTSSVFITTTVNNTTEITTTSVDTDISNNSSTIGLTVIPQADLVISKSDAPDSVLAGNLLTYTVRITNNGPSDAANVVVTDTLPANVAVASAPSCTPATGTVTCVVGSLSAGSSLTYTIVVTVDTSATGTLVNTATITSSTTLLNLGDDTATETTTINTEADLEIGKTATPAPATAGELLTYTVSITNNGPSDALNVLVTDTLPTGVTFSSTLGGICAEGITGYPTCTLNTVDGGTTVSYQIVVTVSASSSGNITNVATTTSSTTDPSSSNNVISQTTAIQTQADLEIVKTSWPEPVVAGQQLTYTLTITNNGPSDIAIPITITDILDNGVTFDWATGSCGHNAGTVTCTVASLTANNSLTRTIVVTVNSNAQGTIVTPKVLQLM